MKVYLSLQTAAVISYDVAFSNCIESMQNFRPLCTPADGTAAEKFSGII